MNMERKFAKLLFTEDARMAIYKRLANLIKNSTPLDKALEYLNKRASKNFTKPKEPLAVVLDEWMRNVRNGRPLSQAMGDFVPDNERMIISAGEQSGDIVSALMSVVSVVDASKRMRKAVLGAVFYPLFLFASAIGVLILFGIKVIPMFAKVSKPEAWTGGAYQMYAVSNIVNSWMLYAFLAVCFAGIIATLVSLPTFVGPVRVKLDKIPPWSTYRIWVGSGFIISLSALIKAGMPTQKALISLSNSANPWLKERINAALVGIKTGVNLGVALERAGHNFPDEEIIEDLIVYANQQGFDVALEIIGREWLENGVTTVKRQADAFNGVAKGLMGAVIGWIVYGTFDLQNQITDAVTRMGSGVVS